MWVFFLVLIIIFFVLMILGCLYIFYIIGMILVGVVIGEYGFNVFEWDSSFELFGKVGFYYIMFLVGLEMDMEDFKKNWIKGLVFGWFIFIILMVLGVWSSMELLGYGFIIVVLFVSMYVFYILIVYFIISCYGLFRFRSVNIIIGGMVVMVMLVLIIFVVIGGMYKGIVDGMFWVLLVVKVVFLSFLIVFFFLCIG